MGNEKAMIMDRHFVVTTIWEIGEPRAVKSVEKAMILGLPGDPGMLVQSSQCLTARNSLTQGYFKVHT